MAKPPDNWPQISWTRPKLKKLKAEIRHAKTAKIDRFVFEGHIFLVRYAEYLAQYLETKLPKDNPPRKKATHSQKRLGRKRLKPTARLALVVMTPGGGFLTRPLAQDMTQSAALHLLEELAIAGHVLPGSMLALYDPYSRYPIRRIIAHLAPFGTKNNPRDDIRRLRRTVISGAPGKFYIVEAEGKHIIKILAGPYKTMDEAASELGKKRPKSNPTRVMYPMCKCANNTLCKHPDRECPRRATWLATADSLDDTKMQPQIPICETCLRLWRRLTGTTFKVVKLKPKPRTNPYPQQSMFPSCECPKAPDCSHAKGKCKNRSQWVTDVVTAAPSHPHGFTICTDCLRKIRRMGGTPIPVTRLKPPGKPKPNPRMVRLGKAIQIKYEREIGKHRGFYKHDYTSGPSVYASEDKVVIKEK